MANPTGRTLPRGLAWLGILIMLVAGIGMAEQGLRTSNAGWVVSGVGCFLLGVVYIFHPTLLLTSGDASRNAWNSTSRSARIAIFVGGILVLGGILLRLVV